jgi:2-polyprenyl-6-methoxyphenol hydroxylase-like FAD-dependent oxidoreductase
VSRTPIQPDVVVAGGGIAGSAVTAALSQLGYSVLVIEPGLDNARRLAGELIHPPGVAKFGELGLRSCLEEAGGAPVQGFVVSNRMNTQLLPYSEAPGLRNNNRGLAIEHGRMAAALLGAVSAFPGVTVWRGARVTNLDVSPASHAVVTVSREGEETRLTPKLVVAADGRNSRLRAFAGIAYSQTHISNMLGYLLTGSRLPSPGFGHVFAGAGAPVLAYEIGRGEIRIMFDVPLDSSGIRPDALAALPAGLRAHVERAIATQSPVGAANHAVENDTVFRGRMICAGDSGGCCHPLAATGLSACVRDAILLREALRENRADIPAALLRYAELRRRPQRTRLVGADLLYRVFSSETPDMRLVRNGLFRYWQGSARARAVTMALLSTQEDRFGVMVREYLNVCRSALPDLIRGRGMHPSHTRSGVVRGLSRQLIRLVGGR